MRLGSGLASTCWASEAFVPTSRPKLGAQLVNRQDNGICRLGPCKGVGFRLGESRRCRAGRPLPVRQDEQGGIIQRQQFGGAAASASLSVSAGTGGTAMNRRNSSQPEDQGELNPKYQRDQAPPAAARPGSRFSRCGGHGEGAAGERRRGAAVRPATASRNSRVGAPARPAEATSRGERDLSA